MIFDLNKYKQEFTAKITSYYISNVTKQSDGLYSIKLENSEVVLPNCVEIFPNTKYYQTYRDFTAEELKLVQRVFFDDSTLTKEEIINGWYLLTVFDARQNCNIFENKTDGKYYLNLNGLVSTEKRDIELFKEKIVMSHITLGEVGKLYEIAVVNKDEKAADALMKEKISKSTFKISPYEVPGNTRVTEAIKLFGTFFSPNKTSVHGAPNNTLTIVGSILATIIVIILIYFAYNYFQKKNNSAVKTTNTSAKTTNVISFGKNKKRRNLK
jgi:hypothetical protein